MVGEDQVAGTLAQRMHRLTDVGRHQPAVDRNAVAPQLRQPGRKKAQRQRVRGGDAQHLAALAFEIVQIAHHLADLLDQVARGDQEQLAGLGQLHRRARAIHQGQPQRALQAADAPAERRLGNETPLGGLREAAGGRQRDQIFQPFGFDVHAISEASSADRITLANDRTSQPHYADPAWHSG